MILHTVLLEPDGPDAMATITDAMTILHYLSAELPDMLVFRHGPNRDYEGKSQRYSYGFLCTFTEKAALDAYAVHPDHQRAGAMLVASCKNGADGIFVADLEV